MVTELQPFLKWAGGKRQLLPEIKKYVPSEFDTYYEPFIGAGAVLFDLAPTKAVINDNNSELINLYKVIKDKEKLEQLIIKLGEFRFDKETYYQIREEDRSKDYHLKSEVEKAARFIYLNKSGFNGLYRVNASGYFNVPIGKFSSKPDYVNETVLRKVHDYLENNEIHILNGDFQEAVREAKAGDLVYFDPPYDPVSDTASFTSYTKDSFGDKEQIRLRNVFIDLYERGCYVLLSNSDTTFVNRLYNYPGIEIVKVEASRNINSNGTGRGKVKEVLVIGNGREKDNQNSKVKRRKGKRVKKEEEKEENQK